MKFGHKYGAKNVTIDNIKFNSILEGNCYEVIRDSGINFEMQTQFILQEKFKTKRGATIQPIKYVCDFFVELGQGKYVIDSKGMLLPQFKIKAKMFLFREGTPIICVGSKKKMGTVCDMIKLLAEPEDIIEAIKPVKRKKKQPKLKQL